MTARRPISAAPLRLRVKEPSPGLFSWVVTQLPVSEHESEVCIDASDHPYASHEAAMSVGTACLQAHKAAARESFFNESYATALPVRQQIFRN